MVQTQNSHTKKIHADVAKRKWHSTKLEEACLVWLESFTTHKNVLCNARAAYYSEKRKI